MEMYGCRLAFEKDGLDILKMSSFMNEIAKSFWYSVISTWFLYDLVILVFKVYEDNSNITHNKFTSQFRKYCDMGHKIYHAYSWLTFSYISS